MNIKDSIGDLIYDYIQKETPINDEITRDYISNLVKDKLQYFTIKEYNIKCNNDNNPINFVNKGGFCLELSIKENNIWRNIIYTIETDYLDINEINE